MKHWQQLSLEDKIDILNITSARTGLPQDVIEKDYEIHFYLRCQSPFIP